MPFSVGDHVQWRHRTGTRAGFVEKVCSSGDEVPGDVFGGKGAARGASSSSPAYVIKQEKDDATIVKPHGMLSAVKGDDSGASREEIVSKDRETKQSKTRGKKNVEGRYASGLTQRTQPPLYVCRELTVSPSLPLCCAVRVRRTSRARSASWTARVRRPSPLASATEETREGHGAVRQQQQQRQRQEAEVISVQEGQHQSQEAVDAKVKVREGDSGEERQRR